MTRDERSLLLYFETCLVDREGRVDSRRMNSDDFEIVKRWNEEAFVFFGRIRFRDIRCNEGHWVDFSEDAWGQAHSERRARAERLLPKRNYERAGMR